MKTVVEFQEEACQYVDGQVLLKERITAFKEDSDKLFIFFLECVLQNTFLLVSYILNNCFENANVRAAFGNRQDDLGNTAYHYAAIKNYPELIIILNDKRPFKGAQCFFSYQKVNDDEKTPLDLCCQQGNLAAFEQIWKRAGKSNHNPFLSLRFACLGRNEVIVQRFLEHPKLENVLDQLTGVVKRALAGKYGEKIKNLFERNTVITKKFTRPIPQLPATTKPEASKRKAGTIIKESEAKRFCEHSLFFQVTSTRWKDLRQPELPSVSSAPQLKPG